MSQVWGQTSSWDRIRPIVTTLVDRCLLVDQELMEGMTKILHALDHVGPDFAWTVQAATVREQAGMAILAQSREGSYEEVSFLSQVHLHQLVTPGQVLGLVETIVKDARQKAGGVRG